MAEKKCFVNTLFFYYNIPYLDNLVHVLPQLYAELDSGYDSMIRQEDSTNTFIPSSQTPFYL